MEREGRKYAALMRASDITMLMHRGSIHPFFPVVEIEDSLEVRHVETLLNASNALGDGNDVYVVVASSSRPLLKDKNVCTSNLLCAHNVERLFAVAYETANIPEVNIPIEEPLDGKLLAKALIDKEVGDAFNGVRELFRLFNVDYVDGRQGPSLRGGHGGFIEPAEMRSIVMIGRHGQALKGGESVWNYLINYRRACDYPEGLEGYVLDAIHVAYSFSVKRFVDSNMAASSLWQQKISCNRAFETEQDLRIRWRHAACMLSVDEGLFKMTKQLPPDFYRLALLYFAVMAELRQGALRIRDYYGSIEKMLQRYRYTFFGIDPEDRSTFDRLLYLIGVTFGYTGLAPYL